jgi:hypothetical protein
MSLARLPLPDASSESARIRPRAEASGIVRNARRKLLPWKRYVDRKGLFSLFVAICTAFALLFPFHFKCPRSPSTDLARVTARKVQHMKEEAQLTCQTELLLAKVILD